MLRHPCISRRDAATAFAAAHPSNQDHHIRHACSTRLCHDWGFAPCPSLGQPRQEPIRHLREPAPNFHSQDDLSTSRLHANELRVPSFLGPPGWPPHPCRRLLSVVCRHRATRTPTWCRLPIARCRTVAVRQPPPPTCGHRQHWHPGHPKSRTNAFVLTRPPSLSANAGGCTLQRETPTAQHPSTRTRSTKVAKEGPHQHAQPARGSC